MDTLQASTQCGQNAGAENAQKSAEPEAQAKPETAGAPEPVPSASTVRRRRNLSKKQTNRAREQTPGRDAVQVTSSEEDEKRPRTPERRRRKPSRVSSASVERSDPTKAKKRVLRESKEEEAARKPSVSPKGSIPGHSEQKKKPDEVVPKGSPPVITPKQGEHKRKNSLVSITQAEFVALFKKAKQSITSGRDRVRRRKVDKSAALRSQSVPSQFTENDLLEGLRKAHLLEEGDNDAVRKPYKRPSSGSSVISSSSDEKPTPKPYRPVVQACVAKRRQQRQYSPKIIEILDPKTAKVVGKITKGPQELKIGFLGFLQIFRYLSVLDICRVYKAFKLEKRSEYNRIARLRNKCIADLMIIIIFCGLGGIMFKHIEGAFENFYKCGVKRVKRDFVDLLWYRSHNLREEEWKSLARGKLRIFEEELHAAHEAGMHSYSGQRSWSFLNGVVYCLTVVTTIGYGHICPSTITGRAITIVYAIIGIPLFLIALTDFGKLFTRGIKFLWSFVRRLYYTGSCRKVRKTAHVADILQGAHIMYEIATLRRPSMFTGVDPASLEEDPENPKQLDGTLSSAGIGSDTPTTPAPSNFEIDDEFNLPISLAIFILVLYIFLGAVMYCALEGWDFFASFYFVFISMSTIGFGDYVPENPICMIASIVYLVFGLALMSMCINVVQVKLSDTFKDASAKLGATIGLNVNEDDGSIDTVTPSLVEVPDVHVTEEQPNNKNEEEQKKNGKSNSKKEKKSSMKVRDQEKDKDKDGDKEDGKADERPKTPKEVKF